MIDSVLEFIARAASSSAFIFCFCNLIIVIILIDLKPSLSLDQGSEIPPSVIRNTAADDKQERNSKCVVEGNKRSGETRGVSTPQEEQALAMDKVENEDNHGCSNEAKVKAEEDEDEDDNDELRRRVEEFIEKVNKAWKAEMLNTSNLV
ncbi:hypothetical protein L6164_008261 [Bauhinia variegata]|uniref:Uncharacterized protein n=1 Tax=Bauhinia variegata TaxID=167791 RepID=A0ACB9PG51_BAUVA|nr:hypothetical protein L6164_008261 [Bauhinia variegata]